MNRPEPDALLIAQHMSEWPVMGRERDEPCRAVYLYRVPPDHHLALEHGYMPPGGIGKTEANGRLRTVRTFGAADMVRLHLVFVPDEDMNPDEAPHLGRDVFVDEWCEAREWLEQEETTNVS